MWNWIKWFFGVEAKVDNKEKEAAVATKVEQEIKAVVQEVAAAKVAAPEPTTPAPAPAAPEVKKKTGKGKATKKNAKK